MRSRHGKRRVVITGIGLLTGLGEGQEVWSQLLAGRSAIKAIADYDPASFRTRIGAEIVNFDPQRFASRRTLRMTTRNDQLAIAGATLAMADAGLPTGSNDPARVGVFVGGAKEVCRLEHLLPGTLSGRADDGRADYRQLGRNASSSIHPLFYVEGLQSAALFYLSQAFGCMGPNAYFHGTAEAGAVAIGRGFRAIQTGEADVVLAGGFDDAISWWTMSRLDGLGVLTDANERGQAAFRPYDRTRSGSVLGEGSIFLVLEEFDAAYTRGAHIYAEITGFGSTFDRHSTVSTDPHGKPLAAAIERSLAEAQLRTSQIALVVAHGCATRDGDASEAAALRSVFDGDRPLGTSVKPATGHLVAAAGALNVAVAALAVDSGAVPATLNLDEPDPKCSFNWLRNRSHLGAIGHGVALARGLHGQQIALTVSGV